MMRMCNKIKTKCCLFQQYLLARFYGKTCSQKHETMFLMTRSVVFMVRSSQKKQEGSVPCSILFSFRYIDEKIIFRQRFVSGSG